MPNRSTAPSIIAATAIMLLLTPAAHSQSSRTIYGSDGKVSGRTHTDSQGSTTIYGADGRVTGRTSTDSSGTTTFYGADGRKTGTVTTQPKREGR